MEKKPKQIRRNAGGINPDDPSTYDYRVQAMHAVRFSPEYLAKEKKEAETKLKKVLIEYRKCGVMSQACKAAQVRRSFVYNSFDKYPKFKIAWDEAFEEFIEDLEAEAFKRAKYKSDDLMKFMLKAHKSKKYANADGNNPEENPLSRLTPEAFVGIAMEISKTLQSGETATVKIGARRVIPTVDQILDLKAESVI